jgi:hypothetical protein
VNVVCIAEAPKPVEAAKPVEAVKPVEAPKAGRCLLIMPVSKALPLSNQSTKACRQVKDV